MLWSWRDANHVTLAPRAGLRLLTSEMVAPQPYIFYSGRDRLCLSVTLSPLLGILSRYPGVSFFRAALVLRWLIQKSWYARRSPFLRYAFLTMLKTVRTRRSR
jgi:hypothetical protein